MEEEFKTPIEPGMVHPMDDLYDPRPEKERDWPAYNAARQKQHQLFLHLLTDLTDYLDEPDSSGRGRPSTPLSTVVEYAVMREYANADLRKVAGLMEMLQDAGYIQDTCHYTTVSKRLQDADMIHALQRLIHISSMPFADLETSFAADATGLSTNQFDRYVVMKHGGKTDMRRHDWKKLHIMNGVDSNIVTAARVTDGKRHEAPFFEELVNTTANLFEIEEVSADKGYSSRDNLDVVADHGGTPYIPFQRNVTGNARGSYTWMRMFKLFQENRQEFRERYHLRSNVESVFSAIKTRFGHDLKSDNDTALQNEALCKVLAHNICIVIDAMYSMDLDPDFSVEKSGDAVEKIREFRD